ncbi:Protein phosphatase 1D [Eumeta japonica]|uniref:Protein phosphatase 1D n=1 Tax=Eumeta variegata TaxID=151549 RepID=A0A4C2ACM6_EUMVA|nr:Protein phosphatase 1D [Eumeta japonica]
MLFLNEQPNFQTEKWPKTVTGLPSTAGTTASIAFIRRGKIYIGHVGDSAIVLGYQKEGCEEWCARPLTSEHKPEAHGEMERIERCGGKVVAKAGVPRVVWSRPRPPPHAPHQPAVDEIPFLAVARSLGDLWSYNVHRDEFIVSPDPDVGVLPIDPSKFREQDLDHYDYISSLLSVVSQKGFSYSESSWIPHSEEERQLMIIRSINKGVMRESESKEGSSGSVDSMHSTIEKEKRYTPVYSTIDWKLIMMKAQSLRHRDDVEPYKIKELHFNEMNNVKQQVLVPIYASLGAAKLFLYQKNQYISMKRSQYLKLMQLCSSSGSSSSQYLKQKRTT